MAIFKKLSGYHFASAIQITALMTLIGIGLWSQSNLGRLAELDAEKLQHRENVRTVAATLSLLKDAETGQRGFLLTGKDSYLTPYTNAVQKVHEQIQTLIKGLAQDPSEVEKIRELLDLTEDKLDELAETIKVRKSKGFNSALRVVMTDRGRVAMARIQALIDDIIHDQRKQIEDIEKATARLSRQSSRITQSAILFAVLLSGTALSMLGFSRKQRLAVQARLKETNHLLLKREIQLMKVVGTYHILGTAELNSQNVKELIVSQTQSLTRSEGAVIEMIDGNSLVYHTAIGSAERHLGLRIPKNGSFSGLCIETGRALICQDTETDDRVDREACRKVNVRSMITMPLSHHGTIIGVVKAYSSEAGAFSDQQAETLELTAGIISSKLSEALLYEEMQSVISALQHAEKQLTEAKEQAEAATQAKSRFLANMSHEIRTPLNGVIGMSSLLMETALNAEQKDYAQTIQNSADSLLILINDILDYSKIEAGMLTLENIDFDLRRVVTDVTRMMSFAAKGKGLALIESVSTDLDGSRFLGDPNRLAQILTNLVGNAVKFTTEGKVTIDVARDLSHGVENIRFEVKDTGIGISRQALAQMFRPFQQADASTSRRFGGTGLGLSISKHLVEMMGGKIGAWSTEGSGSCFWFSIPLKSSGQRVGAHSSETLPSEQGISSAKVRVLLADDNATNRKIAITMLEKRGFTVDPATNGKEAIEALKKNRYDLILMDCHMPEMDGFEATRLIRINPDVEIREIPIIALTADAMIGDREKCLQAGMTGYVSKPIKAQALMDEIQKVLVAREQSKVA